MFKLEAEVKLMLESRLDELDLEYCPPELQNGNSFDYRREDYEFELAEVIDSFGNEPFTFDDLLRKLGDLDQPPAEGNNLLKATIDYDVNSGLLDEVDMRSGGVGYKICRD